MSLQTIALIFCLISLALVGAAYFTGYHEGLKEGRRQMTAEYGAEIKRLNNATRPEAVKAWLKEGGIK